MYLFQNRRSELEEICINTGDVTLLNVFGEAGIGKTRLLLEAAQQLQEKPNQSFVVIIDLRLVADASENRPEILARIIISQAQDRLVGVWQDVDHVAAQIVAQLCELANRVPVFLMFDTTEALQEDMAFWTWIEEHLVGPLLIDGQIRQVFAGRIPVPWRSFDVRRTVKLLPLGPLSTDQAANKLVKEVLEKTNPSLTGSELDTAVSLILEFSFEHPELSEKIGVYVAQNWRPSSVPELRKRVCIEFVKPYVDHELFSGIEEVWKEILWWSSVLDWFDTSILQRYLKKVAPELVEHNDDFFFIRGIGQLRIQKTVIWRGEKGDQLYGVIRNIVRHCMEVMDPAKYQIACQAAADTLNSIAIEFTEDYPEFQQYQQEAGIYKQRIAQEVQK